MYIKSIELTNIRCFEHIKVDFGRDGKIAPVTVILGDNGTGKSTLLRTIALALAPSSQSMAMFDSFQHSVRNDYRSGVITVKSEDDKEYNTEVMSERYIHTITIYPGNDDELREIEDKLNKTDFSPKDMFVCAYGAARRSYGNRSFSQYSVRDATATLFDYDADLQNPELILRRLGDQSGDISEILTLVAHALMLPKGSIQLGMTGIEVYGPWGDFTPVDNLGDGFRATLTWVLDFLGWVMYYNYDMLQTGIEGVVIIDEIEQHLHPRWQRRVLKLLHELFPKVQFIVTTLSPMVVVGTTDFDDDEVSLTLLQQVGDSVEAKTGLLPPRGLRADQILTSYLFGLETTSDDQTKYEVERLSKLLSQHERTPEQEAEVAQLRHSLGQKLGSEETKLERAVAKATTEVLQSDGTNANGEALPEEAIDLETRRQLQALFDDA
jgi:predicted ATPase